LLRLDPPDLKFAPCRRRCIEASFHAESLSYGSVCLNSHYLPGQGSVGDGSSRVSSAQRTALKARPLSESHELSRDSSVRDELLTIYGCFHPFP
jgi:hypothetical protein